MVIMFLSFAESCDPLNSFNLGVGVGGGIILPEMSAKLIFDRSHIICSEKHQEICGFFSSILSFWMHVPMAHIFMVGWFHLPFSPLSNELRNS